MNSLLLNWIGNFTIDYTVDYIKTLSIQYVLGSIFDYIFKNNIISISIKYIYITIAILVIDLFVKQKINTGSELDFNNFFKKYNNEEFEILLCSGNIGADTHTDVTFKTNLMSFTESNILLNNKKFTFKFREKYIEKFYKLEDLFTPIYFSNIYLFQIKTGIYFAIDKYSSFAFIFRIKSDKNININDLIEIYNGVKKISNNENFSMISVIEIYFNTNDANDKVSGSEINKDNVINRINIINKILNEWKIKIKFV